MGEIYFVKHNWNNLNYYDKFKNEHHFKMRYYSNDVNYTDTTGGNAYLLNFD